MERHLCDRHNITVSTGGFQPFSTQKGVFTLVRGNTFSSASHINASNFLPATMYCVIGNNNVTPEYQHLSANPGNKRGQYKRWRGVRLQLKL